MSRYKVEIESILSFVAGTLFWGGLITFGFVVGFGAMLLLLAIIIGLELYRRL